jgi:8-oxo-dGTP pyrophosphatase MutT (NUDIX family)
MRAAVVIVENGRVALIERVRDGRTYFVFPGGRVESGESPQQAAVRTKSWGLA